MDSDIKISAYVSVFEEKLTKLKKNIKKELDKDKNKRNSSFLKQQLKEAKHLKKVAKNMKKAAEQHEHHIVCPGCGTTWTCDEVCKKPHEDDK